MDIYESKLKIYERLIIVHLMVRNPKLHTITMTIKVEKGVYLQKGV